MCHKVRVQLTCSRYEWQYLYHECCPLKHRTARKIIHQSTILRLPRGCPPTSANAGQIVLLCGTNSGGLLTLSDGKDAKPIKARIFSDRAIHLFAKYKSDAPVILRLAVQKHATSRSNVTKAS